MEGREEEGGGKEEKRRGGRSEEGEGDADGEEGINLPGERAAGLAGADLLGCCVEKV